VTAEVERPLPRWAGVGASLEILGLWALAGAQPLFDLFGRNAEFFLASNAGPGEILVFTLVVAFFVPLVLILVESVVRFIRPSIGPTAHRVVIGLLAATLGLNIARQVGAGNLFLALLFAVALVLIVLAIQRNATGRTVLHYLGVAPLAFALLFVFSSDAGSLMFADDAEVVEVQQAPTGGGPVAVLVFDELPLASLLNREGEINAQRFPNFARLAEMSTWYRDATSVAPSTPESVPTVLTGQYPEAGLLPTSADRPINIFTLLGGEYDVDAFEGVTDLCPDEVCTPEEQPDADSFRSDLFSTLSDASVVYGYLTLPESLQHHLPTLGQSWAGFLDQPDEDIDQAPSSAVVASDPADTRDDLTDFLVGRADEARARGGQGRDLVPLIEDYSAAEGSLLVGHDPFMPHRPWHITPTGAAYDGLVGGVEPGMERWPASPAFVRRVLQRHLLQVGFADTLLGRLLDRFEAAGTLDDATIAVVADHGMAFQTDNAARSPNEDNVQEVYRVPMLIKAPGQGPGEGEVSDRNALLVDVLPTILDLTGIEPPDEADFDGQSLVSPDFDRAEDDDKPVFYGQGPQSVPGGFSELYPVIFRNVGYVGDGGWVSLLQVGPAGHFVNRRVEALDRSRPVEGEWVIDQQELLEEVPDTRFRPVTISGRVELDDDDQRLPSQVLVAIDGIIAGIGDLERDDGSFAALLDERRLSPGPHDVALYLPDGEDTIQRIVEP
jgi:hypothetical protein